MLRIYDSWRNWKTTLICQWYKDCDSGAKASIITLWCVYTDEISHKAFIFPWLQWVWHRPTCWPQRALTLSLHGYWNICACAHVCQRQLHKYPHSPSCVTFFRLCVTEVSVRSSSLSLTFLRPFLLLHTNYITISTSSPTRYNLDEVTTSFSMSSLHCR